MPVRGDTTARPRCRSRRRTEGGLPRRRERTTARTARWRTRKREPAGLPGPVYSTLWPGGRDSQGGRRLAWLSSWRAVCSAPGPVLPVARRAGSTATPRGGFATSGPEDVAGRDYYRPVGSHEIQHLVHEYGCLLVFVAVGSQAVGLPVPGTTALIAAALYAATAHGLPIIGVIAAGALGALAGTSAGFAVGRWGGEGVLLRVGGRLRQSPERAQQLRRQFACHGVAWLFVGRFISGVRNATGLLAGASGMSLSRFLPVSTPPRWRGHSSMRWSTTGSVTPCWERAPGCRWSWSAPVSPGWCFLSTCCTDEPCGSYSAPRPANRSELRILYAMAGLSGSTCSVR